MYWNEKPYYSLDFFLKNKFHKKMVKLSLDAGFTCPNRDGTISRKGCIFCSTRGSGDFTCNSIKSITEQIKIQKQILSKKWSDAGYIAYFQAFTNTYAPIDILEKKYEEALSAPDISAIAIATRPDCLDENVLALLKKISKKTYVWVELGFQTSNETTASFINRGYKNNIFETAVKNLHAYHIDVVVHMIVGLPYENRNDMLSTITYLSNQPIQGIKIHMLHILKNTPLEKIYLENPFSILSMEDYISIVCECITLLPPHIVIHRLTGDAPKNLLLTPQWSLKKREILNTIHKKLKAENLWQSKNIK